jgi:hypothetical protein
MATTQNLMNKTLRGMRQFAMIIPDVTTSTTDEYLLMILQFVNEAKEEIEESGWAWQALRQTITLTMVAGQVDYDLTIAGEADVDTTDRSRLLYETRLGGYGTEQFRLNDSSLPQVFDVTTTSEGRLREKTVENLERMHFTDNDESGDPQYFALRSDGDSLKLKVWPKPSDTRTIKLRMYVPQAELTSADLTTVLSIPNRPVWTKALFKANEERGSELGKEGSSLHIAYLDAHGAAVANEQTPADSTVFLDK